MLPVRIIGSGQLDRLLDDHPPNVEWVRWITYEDLPREYWGAGCALGIFGNSDKAQRVIPNKAYQALACGTPLITADTRGARELLTDGRTHCSCRPAIRPRWPTRCSGSPATRSSRAGSAPPAGRSTRSGRARTCSAPLALVDRRAPVSLRPRHLLWAAIGAYATGFAALSILRHHAFNTGRFDLGNMTQAVWATAHGHPLAVTNLEGEQTSRLGSHVDPILVAFAPLWWIWPSPSMLLAAQAIAIALGALPVFWLARKHLGSERAALGFALAYLLYPAVQWLTLAEFHPVALACPLLLYAFWYLDEDRLVPFAVFAGLAALTKEEIPLVIAGIGIWYALSRKRYRIGGAIAAVGTVMTAFSVKVVMPHFNAETSSRFYQRYGALGDSPGEILATIFTHPGRAREHRVRLPRAPLPRRPRLPARLSLRGAHRSCSSRRSPSSG